MQPTLTDKPSYSGVYYSFGNQTKSSDVNFIDIGCKPYDIQILKPFPLNYVYGNRI